MLLSFVILYLLLTLLVGFWAALRVKNTRDFVIAGKRLPLIVAASALFATWFGSETLMGASSEFVEHGLLGVIEDPFGAALCLILVGLFFARPLYRLNILTFNDYFKIRYNQKVELVSAVFMIPSYFGWIAAQLVAMAIVLQVLVGLPIFWGVLLCTGVVVVYTYVGGMWAVSITDFIQTVVIVVGLLFLTLELLGEVGGFEVVMASTPEGFFRFFPEWNFHDVVHYIAAWITIGLGSIPQQDVFQRVMAARDERTAVHSSILGGFMYLSIGFMPLLIGLCGKILYPEEIAHNDPQTVLPLMVLQHGSMFLQILFFGALLSAILSTTSGAILAPATVFGENIVRPYSRQMSDERLLKIMRLAVVGVAVLSALMALWKSNIYDLVAQSSALSLVSLFVPLTAGLYWKRASETGAMLSILTGMGAWLLCEALATEIPSLIYGLAASIGGMVLGTLWKPRRTA